KSILNRFERVPRALTVPVGGGRSSLALGHVNPPCMVRSKIISFVATQNPASALKFYAETLGLTLVSDDPFAMVFDGNGTMLRVQKVQALLPAKHTVLGWEV